MRRGGGHRGDGKRQQGRRTVRVVKVFGGPGRKIQPVEGLRRRETEVGVIHQFRQHVPIHRTRGGQPPILIHGGAPPPGHPIIQQGIGRTGIEGKQCAGRLGPALADPGHVRDAAQIEHRQRFFETAGERPVIERRKRRPLSAVRHVVAAEIIHHIDAGKPGQPLSIAELQRGRRLGRMVDGLTVKADDIDVRRRQAGLREQCRDLVRVAAGQLLLHGRIGRGPAQAAPQTAAERGIVGSGQ